MQEGSNEQPAFRWTGRYVVIGMLMFGVTMVLGMWVYWELYTRPFRALQNAINAEFPNSSPRVIGGREKSHRADSPATLRIIVRVEFDPVSEVDRSKDMAERLAALAKEHHDVSKYDVLEIHLEQRIPEDETQHLSISKPVDDWGKSGATDDESGATGDESGESRDENGPG